jgi:hypothetical protein
MVFKSNFLIFSLGLDYLGDTLDLPTEFDSEKKLEDREDKRVKQLKYLSGIGYKDVSFHFNVTHRDFNSKITSRGFKTYSGLYFLFIITLRNSGLVTLNDGDEISWYTTYTEYEGKAVFELKYSTMEFGVKYTTFEAPTEIRIQEKYSIGDILMYTENKMISVFCAGNGLSHIAGDFYIKYYVPFNIAGYYYAENDYFKVKNKKTFSNNTFSQTASSCGNFGLGYILKHLLLRQVLIMLYFSYLQMKDVLLNWMWIL